MSYFDVASLREDQDFLRRVTACYAVETLVAGGEEPNFWTTSHSWDLAAQPGFGDAYAYAVNSGNVAPGKDPAVVTDAQILAAVQSVMAAAG